MKSAHSFVKPTCGRQRISQSKQLWLPWIGCFRWVHWCFTTVNYCVFIYTISIYYQRKTKEKYNSIMTLLCSTPLTLKKRFVHLQVHRHIAILNVNKRQRHAPQAKDVSIFQTPFWLFHFMVMQFDLHFQWPKRDWDTKGRWRWQREGGEWEKEREIEILHPLYH